MTPGEVQQARDRGQALYRDLQIELRKEAHVMAIIPG